LTDIAITVVGLHFLLPLNTMILIVMHCLLQDWVLEGTTAQGGGEEEGGGEYHLAPLQ
jgi:hypothetical protein